MKILTFPDKLLELGSIFFPACVTYSEENSHRSLTLRRDGRVAEGARLESVFTRKGNVGSNPTLSAIFLTTWPLCDPPRSVRPATAPAPRPCCAPEPSHPLPR